MTHPRTNLVAILMLAASCCSCTRDSQEEPLRLTTERGQAVDSVIEEEADSLQTAITQAMTEARQAVNELGVTEVAMRRIEAALSRLAQAPGLKERIDLGEELHGGGVAAAILASDGDDSLTLVLARFAPEAPTPIHDHGTWAVAYLVEGQDRYVQWERVDDGSDPRHAELRVKSERVLGPGDSVYWFDPPHDIHSQQAKDGAAWELVLFGKNAMRATRHYFDLETGRVTDAKPQ